MNTVVAEVFPAGVHLREELEARGCSQEDFADTIGWSHRNVDELLKGQAVLTVPMAADIGAFLGTSPALWLNLEKVYRHGDDRTSDGDALR